MTIIYYCGQESLRRNGAALIVNKRVQNAVLGCNLKNDRMILVVSKEIIQHHSNPSLCPNHWCWRSWHWLVLWRSTRSSRNNTERWIPRSVGAQYATREEWRNISRKNEETEPKWKQHPVVDVTGDGSKIQCCTNKANWKWSNKRQQEWTMTF